MHDIKVDLNGYKKRYQFFIILKLVNSAFYDFVV